jgi:hypothetical protein
MKTKREREKGERREEIVKRIDKHKEKRERERERDTYIHTYIEGEREERK